MARTRFAAVFLYVVLLGSQSLTVLAQGRNSEVKTTLTETDPVDVGTIVSLGSDSVTVKNERFTRVFLIDARTELRRVDSSRLQVGDFVAVRCHFDNKGTAIADSIEANVDHWEGKITKVFKDTAWIKFDAPVKRNAEVIFDSLTDFRYCARDDPRSNCTVDDLKVGRHLDTIGFVTGKNEMRATRVLGIQSH